MPDGERRWEVAELIAALDDGIAGRLLAAHPATGRCWSCRTNAPCSARTLAEAVDRVRCRRPIEPTPGGRRAPR